MRPVWLDTVDAKFAAVDTKTLYEVAFVTAFQLRLTDVAWFVEPLVGSASVGTAGVAMIVPKLQALDHALLPILAVAARKALKRAKEWEKQV